MRRRIHSFTGVQAKSASSFFPTLPPDSVGSEAVVRALVERLTEEEGEEELASVDTCVDEAALAPR